MTDIAWTPTDDRIRNSTLARLYNEFGVSDFEELRTFALKDCDAYWNGVIKDLALEFDTPFSSVLEPSSSPEWPTWFAGGQLNFTNWVLGAGADKDTAVIYTSEDGTRRVYTRAELSAAVDEACAKLRALGVQPGDRVGILLPNRFEAVVLMLAVARVAAVVVPLYSGFGPEPIATRLNDCAATLLISCGSVVRNYKTIDLRPTLAEACSNCSMLKTIVFTDDAQTGSEFLVDAKAWTDIDTAGENSLGAVLCSANDPWMIIYTSGTTGVPKGTVHTHAGFPLRVAHDVAYYFDFAAGDRFFWFSDMGWMIGPMAVCAPLMLGGSLVLYDGSPTRPDALRLLDVALDANVTHFGTAPTMLRAMASQKGSIPAERRPDLKTIMTAGEVLDETSFTWAFEQIGNRETPIINYTGGTEVSGGLLTNVVTQPIARSGFNAAGVDVHVDVVGDENESLEDLVGELVIRKPMIGMTKGFWNANKRYEDTYWSKRPGIWSHADLAVRHSNGFWELRGRADDVLKVSGRRVGPTEIEKIATFGSDVIAAAAVGVPDPKSGQAVLLCVVPSNEALDPLQLKEAVSARIAERLGPSLRPKYIVVVGDLPRTRNSKIVRRLVRSLAMGECPGDLSSLENPACLSDLKARLAAAL